MPVELAFSEIMGVIKGSNSSRLSLAPLTREEYSGRSSRLAPAFSMEAERSRVYDVFLAYEATKNDRGETDNVDRVVKLLGAVRKNSTLRQSLGAAFHEIYIDGLSDLLFFTVAHS